MEQGAIVSHGESSLALGDNLEGWKGREAQEGGDIYIYIYIYIMLSHFSRVRLCATPWSAAYQAPPSMGFSKQEYWSGVPLPSPIYTIR